MPDSGKGNCLDLELPGTGLKSGIRRGERQAEAGLGPSSGSECGSWNPAEMKET